MSDHGRIYETEAQRKQAFGESANEFTREFAKVAKGPVTVLPSNAPIWKPPVEVVGGKLLKGLHTCPWPHINVNQDVQITKEMLWRCDCGCLWRLVSRQERTSPMIGPGRLIYRREWVEQVDPWVKMWWTIRSWFHRG